MTLQTSGPISLNDIKTEFSNINASDLNSYRGVTWYTELGTSGTFSTPIGMDQFYSKRRNMPPYGNASASAIWGSNNYLGGKKTFTNTLGQTFTAVTTYQNGRTGWSPLVPRNTDTGQNFSGTQLCAIHPFSNWTNAELTELGITTSVMRGTKYQFTAFNVQQERGTIMSYGTITRTAYLAAKAAGGGNISMSVFNSYQNGGTYDGSSYNRIIPAVLWSHHWSGGSGYAQWTYGYPSIGRPNFVPGRDGVFWASPGTTSAGNENYLADFSYSVNIGTDDLVFPVVDDQNDGGSWNMSISVQSYF